ncbi:MAG: biliverdin-producing heme oxygenase [Planctomycetota bacterium]
MTDVQTYQQIDQEIDQAKVSDEKMAAKDDSKAGRAVASPTSKPGEEEMTFSQRIRSETAQAHRLAESTNFVKGILRGVMDMDSFANMQAGMFLVYDAMETELERHKDHPVLSQIRFSELNRRESLEKDLEFLYGADWKNQIRNTPVRREYVERIQWLGDNDPDLLVAHSYTRYLGDLSGGQVISKIARRSLGLQNRDGLRFFDFDEIDTAKEFKNEYRDRLNQLPLSEVRAQQVIDEAKYVFALNQRLFEELEGSWIRTLVNFIPFGLKRRKRA